jgi:putative transcriptional regulator
MGNGARTEVLGDMPKDAAFAHLRPAPGPRRRASAWRRACLILAGALLPAMALGALPPRLELAPTSPSLLGYVLIATPQIEDRRFHHTVILVVRHDKDGALGLTINRPAGERPLASVLDSLGERDPSAVGNLQIFAGGPVQPEAVFVVHTGEYRRPETIVINEHLAVTSSLTTLHDIAQKRGPEKILFVLGYAGWAPGQLDAERAREDWFVAPAEPNLVFDVRRERVWEQALAHRARDL